MFERSQNIFKRYLTRVFKSAATVMLYIICPYLLSVSPISEEGRECLPQKGEGRYGRESLPQTNTSFSIACVECMSIINVTLHMPWHGMPQDIFVCTLVSFENVPQTPCQPSPPWSTTTRTAPRITTGSKPQCMTHGLEAPEGHQPSEFVCQSRLCVPASQLLRMNTLTLGRSVGNSKASNSQNSRSATSTASRPQQAGSSGVATTTAGTKYQNPSQQTRNGLWKGQPNCGRQLIWNANTRQRKGWNSRLPCAAGLERPRRQGA